MKTLFTFLFLLVGFLSYSQDFGAPRRYDVNVTYSPSFPAMYGSMLMEKRRAYDEGFREVQGAIDEVAALPVKLWGSYEKIPQDVIETVNKGTKQVSDNINTSNPDYSNPSIVKAIKNDVYKIGEWVITRYNNR